LHTNIRRFFSSVLGSLYRRGRFFSLSLRNHRTQLQLCPVKGEKQKFFRNCKRLPHLQSWTISKKILRTLDGAEVKLYNALRKKGKINKKMRCEKCSKS